MAGTKEERQPLSGSGGGGEQPVAEDVDFLTAVRPLFLTLYVPSMLYLISYGAGMVALPLFFLRTLGLPYIYVGGYKIAQELAELLANNPSAWWTTHYGWKPTIAAGAGGFLVASILMLLASLLATNEMLCYWLFLLSYLFQSGNMKFFNRANGILTSELASHHMGRHSNLQAGMRYVMTTAGPLLAAWLMTHYGGPRAVFAAMVAVGVAAFGIISTTFSRENKKKKAGGKGKGKGGKGGDTLEAGVDQHGGRRAQDTGYAYFLQDKKSMYDLLTVSTACLIIVILRGCFNMMIPIQGTHLGLGTHSIAFVFVVANGTGFSLFWVGGLILDNLGRRWSAVPACILFGAGFILLGSATGDAGMLGAAVFFGFGETISGGIKRSLKGDFTAQAMRHRLEQTKQELGTEEGDKAVAQAHKARFSAMIDNVLDGLGMLYPIVLTLIAQYYGAPAACYCFSGIGGVGVIMFGMITETLKKKNANPKTESCLKIFLAASLTFFTVVFILTMFPSLRAALGHG